MYGAARQKANLIIAICGQTMLKGSELVQLRDHRFMSEWLGVIGALAGGTIALLGQFVFGALELKREQTKSFTEQCAQVLALEEDFRNRVWEERRLGRRNQVDEWSLRETNKALAHLRILSGDAHLLEAIRELRKSGKELGVMWRTKSVKDDELDQVWREHRESLNKFEDAARRVLSRK